MTNSEQVLHEEEDVDGDCVKERKVSEDVGDLLFEVRDDVANDPANVLDVVGTVLVLLILISSELALELDENMFSDIAGEVREERYKVLAV